jgi:hypothetical protein
MESVKAQSPRFFSQLSTMIDRKGINIKPLDVAGLLVVACC